jgi:hypothetical protein
MATSGLRCLPSAFSYKINGHELIAPEPDPLILVTRLACDEMVENALAEWIHANDSPLLD